MSRHRASPHGAGQRRRLCRLEQYVRAGKPFMPVGRDIIDNVLVAYVEMGPEVVQVPWTDLETWVTESDAKEDQDNEPLPYDVRTHTLLRMLTPQQRLSVATVIEHMCEVATGDRYGSFTSARPNFRSSTEYRKKYDPERHSIGKRMRKKSKELTKLWGRGWSVPRLYDKMHHVLHGGERGISVLFDARTHAKLREFTQIKDKRVWEALDEVVAMHTAPGVSTLSWENRDADFLAALERHGVEPTSISKKLRLDLIDHAEAGTYLDSPGSTRTSKNVSPKYAYGHRDVVRPGQVIEIDSTPLNAFCRTPNGEPISAEVLVAIDVCTRMILALRVLPLGAASRDVKLLLHDVMSGVFRRKWRIPHRGQWSCLPEAFAIPEGMRPVVKGISTDRGPQMDSMQTMASLQARGVDVGQTPTCSGAAKGIVEAVQFNWAQVYQGLPGDKGASPRDKGDQTNALPGPTLEQAEYLMWQYINRVYHLRKHPSVRDPLDHRRQISPTERFINASSPFEEIFVPIGEDFIADFLYWGTARATYAGMKVNKHNYQWHGMDDLRDEVRGTRSDPLDVRYDPYNPSHVLVRRPSTGKFVSVALASDHNDVQTVGDAFVEADLLRRRANGERTDFTMSATETALEKGRVRFEYREMVNEANEKLAREERARTRQEARERRATQEKRRLAEKDPALAGVFHRLDNADVVDLAAARDRKVARGEPAKGQTSQDVRTFTFEDIP